MAQTYVADVPDGTTNILQDNINGRNNENALRSSFSGTAFPDTPVAGQHCYRTDTGKEYIYSGTAWVEVAATNTLGLDVAAAKGTLSNLSSRLNISINPDGTLKDPTTANVDEFKVSNVTPTYVDDTTFSVPDDLTGIFTAGRILKITDGAEIKYISVVSSVFDTVTNVVIDGTITASISAVDYSLAQYGLPLATETVKGVVELATSAEVLAGVDTERVITPATLTAKILGTVSEVDGVPTGAVIESGNNANGTYIKFADGTMICYSPNGLLTGYTDHASGVLYTDTSRLWTYPAPFPYEPVVFGSERGAKGSRWCTCASEGAINGVYTKGSFMLMSSFASTSVTNAVLSAIGRWY